MPRILNSQPVYDDIEEKWFFRLIDASRECYHMSPSLYSNQQDAEAAAVQFLKVAMQGRFSPGS